MSNVTTADLLREYGSAIRGDWSYLDGRSVRSVLDELAEMVEEHGAQSLPIPLVSQRRAMYGLCPLGRGHWETYCGDHHEPVEEA